MRVPCVFWTAALYVSFANVSSQFITSLFILMTVPFLEHKYLILMKSTLQIISFMDCALGLTSKKSYSRSLRFFLLYYLLEVYSFCLTFTFISVNHFELIFVAHGCLVLPAPFFEKTYYCSIVLPLILYQKSVDSNYVGLFLDILFSSFDLFVYSFTKVQCLDYSSLLISLEVEK